MVSEIIHDYETRGRPNLTVVGADRYFSHPETKPLMVAFRIDKGPIEFWDHNDSVRPPRHFIEAISDPHVHKKAFAAQFERLAAKKLLKVDTGYRNWRCTMVKAFSQSFTGGLDDIAQQLLLPKQFRKDKEGERLIKLFSMPQKITKNQPHEWRDIRTDPEDWEKFCSYCRQDVVSEEALEKRLAPYPMPEDEWELYELDQEINDRGMPVNIKFVGKALEWANRRTEELKERLHDLTGVDNPNSRDQLLPWLQDRGYWFEDLRADTVQKVLNEGGNNLSNEAREVLLLRQWAARSSTAKLSKLLEWTGEDGNARYMFQFGGASRTNRWAGRGPQPQNLPRTPKMLESHEGKLISDVVNLVTEGTYEDFEDWLNSLDLKDTIKNDRLVKRRDLLEPLVGSVRSSFQVLQDGLDDDEEFVVCDLSAIESRGIGWLTGCERLNQVFIDERDPYIDFGVDFYQKPYELISKGERSNCKPAVLGAGYRLGGGDLFEGKRTGLWGYAENMGIDLTQEESHAMVVMFREKYPEVPQFWYALERASINCVRTGKPQECGPIRFEMMNPYLTCILPSGRRIYYQFPQVRSFEQMSRAGRKYVKHELSYMAKHQKTGKWVRIQSHGGLLIENIVQAMARDVLKVGLIRAKDYGFNIIGHVHDEIICKQRKGDDKFNLNALRAYMRFPIWWAPGLILDAAGYSGRIYRKD